MLYFLDFIIPFEVGDSLCLSICCKPLSLKKEDFNHSSDGENRGYSSGFAETVGQFQERKKRNSQSQLVEED